MKTRIYATPAVKGLGIKLTMGERLVFAVTLCSKHDTLIQCWLNVGPASQTMDQYQPKLNQSIFFAGPLCGESEIIQPSIFNNPLTAK